MGLERSPWAGMPPQGANAFLGQIATIRHHEQVEALVEGIRTHKQAAKVQEQACIALDLAVNDGNKVRAAGAGAIEAVVEGMRTHMQATKVQEGACMALGKS